VSFSHINLSGDYSLIKIFIERDEAGGVGVGCGTGVGLKAVGGTFFLIFVPEIAALPDAVAQAGEGADGGGMVPHVLESPLV
jgi:hypothetical protein